MKVRIYYEDTDAGGIVYHANYIKFCERARSELFFNSNLEPFSGNRHFVVSKIEANFIKPAFLADILEIKTEIKSMKKASLVMMQKIYRVSNLKTTQEPELLFFATISLAFLVNKKVSKMDDEMIKFMQKHAI